MIPASIQIIPRCETVLVPGYDFTRNQNGEGDETGDVPFSDSRRLRLSQSSWVNPSSAALVDQSTVAVVDGNPQYGDFGHGTMVAGVIHLVAPRCEANAIEGFPIGRNRLHIGYSSGDLLGDPEQREYHQHEL